MNFASSGTYPAPNALQQFPLGYAQKKFNQPFSEQASLEVEHQIGKDFYVSLGYQWMHASRLPVYTSINGDCPGHVEANCPKLPTRSTCRTRRRITCIRNLTGRLATTMSATALRWRS